MDHLLAGLKIYIAIGVILIGLCAGPVFGLILAVKLASDIIGEGGVTSNETERDRI